MREAVVNLSQTHFNRLLRGETLVVRLGEDRVVIGLAPGVKPLNMDKVDDLLNKIFGRF